MTQNFNSDYKALNDKSIMLATKSTNLNDFCLPNFHDLYFVT